MPPVTYIGRMNLSDMVAEAKKAAPDAVLRFRDGLLIYSSGRQLASGANRQVDLSRLVAERATRRQDVADVARDTFSARVGASRLEQAYGALRAQHSLNLKDAHVLTAGQLVQVGDFLEQWGVESQTAGEPAPPPAAPYVKNLGVVIEKVKAEQTVMAERRSSGPKAQSQTPSAPPSQPSSPASGGSQGQPKPFAGSSTKPWVKVFEDQRLLDSFACKLTEPQAVALRQAFKANQDSFLDTNFVRACAPPSANLIGSGMAVEMLVQMREQSQIKERDLVHLGFVVASLPKGHVHQIGSRNATKDEQMGQAADAVYRRYFAETATAPLQLTVEQRGMLTGFDNMTSEQKVETLEAVWMATVVGQTLDAEPILKGLEAIETQKDPTQVGTNQPTPLKPPVSSTQPTLEAKQEARINSLKALEQRVQLGSVMGDEILDILCEAPTELLFLSLQSRPDLSNVIKRGLVVTGENLQAFIDVVSRADAETHALREATKAAYADPALMGVSGHTLEEQQVPAFRQAILRHRDVLENVALQSRAGVDVAAHVGLALTISNLQGLTNPNMISSNEVAKLRKDIRLTGDDAFWRNMQASNNDNKLSSLADLAFETYFTRIDFSGNKMLDDRWFKLDGTQWQTLSDFENDFADMSGEQKVEALADVWAATSIGKSFEAPIRNGLEAVLRSTS